MSASHAKLALVLITLVTLVADFAIAQEGGRGFLRRRRGVSTPQTTAASEKNQATEAQAEEVRRIL